MFKGDLCDNVGMNKAKMQKHKMPNLTKGGQRLIEVAVLATIVGALVFYALVTLITVVALKLNW